MTHYVLVLYNLIKKKRKIDFWNSVEQKQSKADIKNNQT